MNPSRLRLALLRILAVLAGGFLGGAIRFALTNGLQPGWRRDFLDAAIGADASSAWRYFDPWLLAVNSIGVLLAVWLILGVMNGRAPDDPWRLFWTTGALGGLTTYSSLILQLGRMGQIDTLAAFEAGLLSFLVASLAAYGGWKLTRQRGSRC
jgi:fluoride ion exporter CrcB/FEX